MEKLTDGMVALFLACLAGLAWLFRLEAKANQNAIDIERLEGRADNSDARHDLILEQLSDIREMTAEIRGVIKKNLDN